MENPHAKRKGRENLNPHVDSDRRRLLKYLGLGLGGFGAGLLASLPVKAQTPAVIEQSRLTKYAAVLPADVIVFRDGDYAVAKNGRTGETIAKSTNHASVIHEAFNYCPNTVYGGCVNKVALFGEFSLTDTLKTPDNTVLIVDGNYALLEAEFTDKPILDMRNSGTTRSAWTKYFIRNLRVLYKNQADQKAIMIGDGPTISSVILENVQVINGYGVERETNPSVPPSGSVGIYINLYANDMLYLKNVKIVGFDVGLEGNPASHLYLDNIDLMYTNSYGLKLIDATFLRSEKIHLYRVGGIGIYIHDTSLKYFWGGSNFKVLRNIIFEGTRPSGFTDNEAIIKLETTTVRIENLAVHSTSYDEIDAYSVTPVVKAGASAWIHEAVGGIFGIQTLRATVDISTTGIKTVSLSFPLQYHSWLTGYRLKVIPVAVSAPDDVDFTMWVSNITNTECEIKVNVKTASTTQSTMTIDIIVIPSTI